MSEVIIKFNPELHRYTDNENNVYTSVTTWVGLHEPKFDELYWARQKAIERNTSIEAILTEWAIGRDNACIRGTATHELIEEGINTLYSDSSIEFREIVKRTKNEGYLYKISNPDELSTSPLKDKLPKIYYKLLTYIAAGYTLYAEKRVHSYKYKIAGTIDLLLVRGKEFLILDWKTNKDTLKFISGYYKKEWRNVNGVNMKVKTDNFIKTNEYLDYPLNNLAKCKGTSYSLQLSLYAYLVEMFGLKCMGLYLYHIVDNNFDNVKDYKIEYLKSDIHRGLDFHFTNRLNHIPKNKFEITS